MLFTGVGLLSYVQWQVACLDSMQARTTTLSLYDRIWCRERLALRLLHNRGGDEKRACMVAPAQHKRFREWVMWNKDEAEGKAKQIKGSVKRKLGEITNNRELENEGKVEQQKGNVQEKVGRARRKVGDAVKEVGKKIGRG
ncbi:MAG TPA: CsbD family protein [Blastocatellia bacterium]|nr:CsbD family protein [Blastocatellia bacterium]